MSITRLAICLTFLVASNTWAQGAPGERLTTLAIVTNIGNTDVATRLEGCFETAFKLGGGP
jgi:hypothetical protein